MADLKVSGLCKRFGHVEVLKDINLDIRSGDRLSVLPDMDQIHRFDAAGHPLAN